MKLVPLLIAVVALSSCASKPYMVGSVHDQITPRSSFKYGGVNVPKQATPGHSGEMINPVASSSMNPVH